MDSKKETYIIQCSCQTLKTRKEKKNLRESIPLLYTYKGWMAIFKWLDCILQENLGLSCNIVLYILTLHTNTKYQWMH